VVVRADADPPLSPRWLGDLLASARATAVRDPSLGGVGFGGGRFLWRRARLYRPAYEQFERGGPVPIDYIAGGHLPLYRVAALRAVGTFAAELFFGFDDLEFGLRLRRGGFSLYGLKPDREVARRERAKLSHMVEEKKRKIGLRYRLPEEPDWREYYALRNTVYILRSFGHSGTAIRVALVRGLLKPLANAVLSPRRGLRHLRLRSRAVRHGLVGRMGRTVEPPGPAHP
jgi:GT2 family glycosyltransferase